MMLTASHLGQWERDGYVPLGQVASDAELAALQQRIDDLMLGRAPGDGIWFQLDSETGEDGDLQFGNGAGSAPTLNYRKIERLERDPLFCAYRRHPVFHDLTRQLIGEDVS